MRQILPWVLFIVAVCVASPSAHAATPWTEHGEDCAETTFRKPMAVPLPRVARCVRLWEAYRDVAVLGDDARLRVVAAMKRLYMDGDDFDAHIARLGLRRLGVTQLPPRGGIDQGVGDAGRAPCEDPPPSSATLKKATKHLKKGLKAYRKGRLDAAMRHYDKAIEIAPGWPRAHYNRAAIHGAKGNEAGAVDALLCVRDLGGDEAVKYLRMARTDEDFAPIRDRSGAFKEITHYARIKLANSLGELGEDNIENTESTLDALGFPVEQVTTDPRRRRQPHIWFKPHSVVLAYMITKILNHPDTVIKPITWADEAYDVLVSWGDRIGPGEEPMIRVQDPDDAEKLMDQYKRAEREALAEPEKMKAQATSVVSDVEGDVQKLEDTVDKVKGAFDAFKSF